MIWKGMMNWRGTKNWRISKTWILCGLLDIYIDEEDDDMRGYEVEGENFRVIGTMQGRGTFKC
jgi:hypothetical protein